MKNVSLSWTNTLLSWRSNNRSRICPQCIFAPVVRSMAAGLLCLCALLSVLGWCFFYAVFRRRLSAECGTAGLRMGFERIPSLPLSVLCLPWPCLSAAARVKAFKQKRRHLLGCNILCASTWNFTWILYCFRRKVNLKID